MFILSFIFCLFFSSSFAQVSADFSATPVAGCASLQVSFSDLSTGNPTTWNWKFGNGGSSTSKNPSVIYGSTGVYTVTLTVTSGASSDTKIKTNYILVYNKPQAGFMMSTDTVCIGQPVTFTDATVLAGGPPIKIWAWDFGDGNTASATIPTTTHTYNTSGTYPVQMSAADTNGCSGKIIKNIVVIPKPTPSFTADSTSVCTPPANVVFTNTSISVGTTTYLWKFGDGSTSAALNPSHTYTASGSYNVTLIVNQNGCIDSLVKTNYIVIQKIVSSFTATPLSICTGGSIIFNNTSVPPAVTAIWNFGDGGTSTAIFPSHTYITAGTYTVTLIAGDASGCVDTATGTVIVHQTPVASFTADTMSACSTPFTVNFINTSSGGTNYLWNFGDGSSNSTLQNPSHIYTAPGTYTVSLIVTNASGPCVNTIVKDNFIVISPPVASFTHSPDSGCVPLTVNFQSNSQSLFSITNYIWNFGDGSSATTAAPLSFISHTYTATGIYTTTLIVQIENGCADTIVCTNCIKVGLPPVANFGILEDTVCYGLPVTFSDSSTGNVTGWYWYFGDGGSGTQQNPIYVYGDTGTFQVYLIAYNNGCPDTSARDTVVILPPKALFTYSLSCTNYYTVQFMSTSQGADSLFWDFGDLTQDSSNIINPAHTYTTRGQKTVTLTAYNYSTGCNNITTGSFIIAEPIASYSVAATSGCYPFSVLLTSTSQDVSTSLIPSPYYWNMGDPSSAIDTSTADTAFYTYNNPGLYTVTLTITDVNGCRDTLMDTLKSLGPVPYFFADTLTGCTPFIVVFTDTSVSDSILVKWTWDFGDGTIMTTDNDSIIHIYTTPGFYTVIMTVRDTNGCIKTIVKGNYIQPTFPFPAFTVDTFACKGDVLTFNAAATSVVGGTYIWNYGDGTGDTTANATTTHTYASDNLYVVSLTVVDTNGCDSTITDTIRILKPVANFGWTLDTVYCGNMLVSFTDSSTGFVTDWKWDFGDGGSSVIQNPAHTYNTGGVYSITLVVTNAGLCKDTIRLDSIITVPLAAGTFTLSPAAGCNPLTVCFIPNAINTLNYKWDFGDGTVINSTGDTCHTYANNGTFSPLLLLEYTLSNGNSCFDPATNLTGPVIVSNVISVSFSGPFTSVPPSYTVTVDEDSIISVTAIPVGGTPPYTYNWNPNTAINCDTCASILIIGTGDTAVLYICTIYDAAGCIYVDSIKVYSMPCVEEKLIPNVFSPNGDGINEIFYIPGVCPEENFFLQIFDRWGALMFSTTLRKNAWDGSTSAGVEAKTGVYYFVVKADDKTHKGFVHLLR